MTDDLVGRLRQWDGYNDDLKEEAAARIEALEGALRALIATYDGMETGDGEPCPDIAAARQLFPKDDPHAD